MEELLRRELGFSSVKATGHSGGGCISQGQSYDTDRGRVFVKVNSKAEVRAAAGRGLRSAIRSLRAGLGRLWADLGSAVQGGGWRPGPLV